MQKFAISYTEIKLEKFRKFHGLTSDQTKRINMELIVHKKEMSENNA